MSSWRIETLTDIDERVPERVPRRGLPARLAEHPPADLGDQPGLLEHRDELVRADDAARRVVPAQQRLHAVHVHRVEVEERLVQQVELAVGERGLQVHLQPEPVDHRRLHLGREQRGAVLAHRLGAVQRDVGVAEQVLAGVAVALGDADAGGDRQRAVEAVEQERLAQHVAEPLGEQLRAGRERHALGEHHELVAAEPADRVAGPDRGREPGRDRAQQLVAGLVPERVVDLLEVVEVDEERGHRLLRRGGTGRASARPGRGSACGWRAR